MKKLFFLSSVLFLTAFGGIETVHLKHPLTGKIVQCDLLPGYTYSDAAAIQLDCINIYILLHGYRRIEGIRETEARLLKVITQLRQGQPDYEQIESGLSAAIKQQLPMVQAKLQALGSLQALSYRGQKQGADSYLVESVNGFSDWTIALSPIGRISTLWFRPHEHQILYCDKGEIALRAGNHDLAVEQVSRCIKQGNLKSGTLAVAYNKARGWPGFVRWCRYAALPIPEGLADPVTIYRGVQGVDLFRAVLAPSWTLSLELAERYANRWPDNSSILLAAEVPLSSLMFYSNERNEEEVISDQRPVDKFRVLRDEPARSEGAAA